MDIKINPLTKKNLISEEPKKTFKLKKLFNTKYKVKFKKKKLREAWKKILSR